MVASVADLSGAPASKFSNLFKKVDLGANSFRLWLHCTIFYCFTSKEVHINLLFLLFCIGLVGLVFSIHITLIVRCFCLHFYRVYICRSVARFYTRFCIILQGARLVLQCIECTFNLCLMEFFICWQGKLDVALKEEWNSIKSCALALYPLIFNRISVFA